MRGALKEVFWLLVGLKNALASGAPYNGATRALSTFSRRQNRDNEIISTPPHSIKLYISLLERLCSEGNIIFTSLPDYFSRTELRDNRKINIILRHDIDFGDPVAIELLASAEKKFGLRSSFHVLCDESIYPLENVEHILRTLASDGYDVGLHTQAWIFPDFKKHFHQDLDRFESVFEFRPKTFSLHGTWPRTKEQEGRRSLFLSELPNLLKGTGVVGYRQMYSWVSEDSAIQGEPVNLRNSFFHPDYNGYPGTSALILTHDNYWKI